MMRLVVFLCVLIVPFAAGAETAKAKAAEFVYDSHGLRDPFRPLVGNALDEGEGQTDKIGLEDVKFQGTARGADGHIIAIINGSMYHKGDTLDGMPVVVKDISSNKVIVSIDGKNRTLTLYNEDFL